MDNVPILSHLIETTVQYLEVLLGLLESYQTYVLPFHIISVQIIPPFDQRVQLVRILLLQSFLGKSHLFRYLSLSVTAEQMQTHLWIVTLSALAPGQTLYDLLETRLISGWYATLPLSTCWRHRYLCRDILMNVIAISRWHEPWICPVNVYLCNLIQFTLFFHEWTRRWFCKLTACLQQWLSCIVRVQNRVRRIFS